MVYLIDLSDFKVSRSVREDSGSCLPFFLGPRQITASSGLFNKKPTDITTKFSSTVRGSQPKLVLFLTDSFSKPTIFGIEGPQISISSRPTFVIIFDVNIVETNVDLEFSFAILRLHPEKLTLRNQCKRFCLYIYNINDLLVCP